MAKETAALLCLFKQEKSQGCKTAAGNDCLREDCWEMPMQLLRMHG